MKTFEIIGCIIATVFMVVEFIVFYKTIINCKEENKK